jgi:hypothetical protein
MADAATESTVPPEVLKTFTDALTTSLGSAMATSGSTGSGGIQVMVGTTPQNGFTLNIIYDGSTYALTFGMPNADDKSWNVKVTITTAAGGVSTPLSFSYNPTDSSWHLIISTPKHTFGSVTIDAISIEMGSTVKPKA